MDLPNFCGEQIYSAVCLLPLHLYCQGFDLLFEFLKPPLLEFDPLASIAHSGVLKQGSENHPETEGEVDIKRLHVRDLGQGPVHGAHEGDHGEHSGDPQPHPGGGRAAVQVEADPGHDHDEAAGHVDLDDVVAHAPTEQDVSTQAAVVTAGEHLQHPPLSVAHHVELGEADVRADGDGLGLLLPDVDHVVHGVAVALYLQGAHLAVHGEVGQVHRACGLHRQPHAVKISKNRINIKHLKPSQNFSLVCYPQELIFLEHLDSLINCFINN